MDKDQTQTEYTEDQLFILNDIADEQERVMQDEIDEEKDDE